MSDEIDTPSNDDAGAFTPVPSSPVPAPPASPDPLVGASPAPPPSWEPPATPQVEPPPPPASTAGTAPGRDTSAGYGQPSSPWAPEAWASGRAAAPVPPPWFAAGTETPGQPGWVPNDPAPDQDATPSPPPSGRRRRGMLLAAGAIFLVAAAGAGGAAIALSVDQKPASQSAATTTSTPGGSGGAPIDVSAIASCIDPAVVDLRTSTGAGTGMVLTPDGTVLTNNHVVSGATSISAQIAGTGRTYKADVLGVDPSQDVAVLRLQGASGLTTVHLGSSAGLAIGDAVVAVGNALDLSGPPTVTQGIVSALDRSITASDPGTGVSENLSGLIQTDASINPGNSGGPLVNAHCQVIGMNTAAATGSSTQSASNIGFAIPIDRAAAIVHQIEAGRASATVLLGERAYVGVAVLSVPEAESPNGLTGPTGGYRSPVRNGAVVANVVSGLPADGAGVQPGDVIVSFDGSTVVTPADLERLIGRTRPYASVVLGWVDTSGARHRSTITLAIAPVK